MKPSPKTEAVETLSHARKILDSPEPLNAVRVAMLRGVLELAEAQVAAIQEARRFRRTPRGE